MAIFVEMLKQDWLAVWSAFVQRGRAEGGRVCLIFGLFWLLTGLAIYWFEVPLLAWVQSMEFGFGRAGWVAFSKWLHEYTKFEWFNLLLGVMMIIGGAWKNSVSWRQAGIAFILAGLIAGAAAQTSKTLTGRPRPSAVAKGKAQSAYDWQGPNFNGGLRSYPSGHTAAVCASCIALGLRKRKLLGPLALVAVLVAWSRVYGDYHWMSDVVHGLGVGAVFGWLLSGRQIPLPLPEKTL